MKTKVLLLSAKRGGGKDTIADFLLRNQLEFNTDLNIKNKILSKGIKRYYFADALKQICNDLFDIPIDILYGSQELKDNFRTNIKWRFLPHWGVMVDCYGCNCLFERFGLKELPNDEEYLTCREFLQQFGTNVMRCMYSNVWVNKCKKTIKKESPYIAVIADVRFENEFDCFVNDDEIDYLSVRLDRTTVFDNHISETGLDSYANTNKFDLLLENSKMTIDETNKAVFEFLQQKKWL